MASVCDGCWLSVLTSAPPCCVQFGIILIGGLYPVPTKRAYSAYPDGYGRCDGYFPNLIVKVT